MSHKCKYAAVGCIDFRFRRRIAKFLKKLFKTSYYDYYSWPGAAKPVVDTESQEWCLKQIGVCADLHKGEQLAIISHTDCGAYGGSAAFTSKDAEIAKLREDLIGAKKLIEQRYLNLAVELYIFDKGADRFIAID